MFEELDLKIADVQTQSTKLSTTDTISCRRTHTGCWITSCNFPC